MSSEPTAKTWYWQDQELTSMTRSELLIALAATLDQLERMHQYRRQFPDGYASEINQQKESGDEPA